MIDEPTTGRLDEIGQRVLVVFGENDGLIPNPYLHGGRTREIGEIAAREIPDCELLMVPNCGHFVQFERPDLVNDAVLEFLAGGASSAR
jgi:pimeloyl-ACP methyl ester carboxylesterase